MLPTLRHLLLPAILLAGALPVHAADQVLVFSGQSNMCGYQAWATELPASQQGVVSATISAYYDQQEAAGTPSPDGGIASGAYWRPTHGDWEGFAAWKQNPYWYVGPNPGDPYTTEGPAGASGTYEFFGPEYNATRTIQGATGGHVYLAKYAHGGTSLYYDWVPTGNLYGSMVYWADQALAARPAGSRIAGFFWMQGEGDTFRAW